MEKKRSPRSSPSILTKSPLVYEKYKSGCAWGLLGLFNFQEGFNRGLITDKIHKCKHPVVNGYSKSQLALLPRFYKKCRCTDDVVDDKKSRVNSKNVRLIREQEMSLQHHFQWDSNAVRDSPKNQTGTSKNLTKSADRAVNDHDKGAALGHKQHSLQNSVKTSPMESKTRKRMYSQASSTKIDRIKHGQSAEINLQVCIDQAADALIKSDRSKHFLDALDILSSNKELFIKLLQDPHSLSVKHIQGLPGSHPETRLAKSSSRAKLLETQINCSVESEEMDEIVVLKSSLMSTKVGKHSLYSRFRSIKKKLKDAIGVSKDELHLSPDAGTMDKFSYMRSSKDGGEGRKMKIATRNPFSVSDIDSRELIKSSKEIVRTKNACGAMNSQRSNSSDTSVHRCLGLPVYKLNQGSETYSRRLMMEKLEMINSMPVHDILLASGSFQEGGHGSVNLQMRYSPYSNNSRFKEKYLRPENEKQECSSSWLRETSENFNEKWDDRFLESDAVPSKEHETIRVLSCGNSKGSENAMEMSSPVASRKFNTYGPSTCTAHERWKDRYLEILDSDLSLENGTSMSQTYNYSSEVSSPDRANDNGSNKLEQEQPSPVSVLEQIRMEDHIASLESIITPPSAEKSNAVEQHAVLALPIDLKINLTKDMERESVHGYVKTALEASELNWTNLLTKYTLSFDQTREPILVYECCDDDQRLVFDYINEVLLKAYHRYVKSSPWVPLKNQNLSTLGLSNDLVKEVMKCFDWNLLPWPQPPITLDQLMGNDLARSESWMDILVDTEEIVAEMVGCVLEELEMEIVTYLEA